jgi:flagellar basal body-associated protein FliL
MKPPARPVPKNSFTERCFRVLVVLAALAALTLIGGTVYALVFRPASGSTRDGDQEETRLPVGPLKPAEVDSVFTGIGRIRTFTAPPEGATVILSIAFPYASADKVFSEELASRIGDFRTGTAAYFASFSTVELRQKDESAIKAELLERFNSILRLGQIGILYFNDYIIIDR